jgi:DNA-binding Lrp family transcriptional regulator
MRKRNELSIDSLDLKLLELLLSGLNNSQMADKLKKPLSTVQRRTRLLIERGLIRNTFTLNYAKMGYKKGLLHVYLASGKADTIAAEIAEMRGILSVSAHIGNSDLVCEFVFRESKQILDLIANVKSIEGVDRIVWSEEVYSTPTKNLGDAISDLEVK